MSVPAWFALSVRANHEWAVQSGLAARGLAHYLPVYQERVKRSDRHKIIDRPLFPGYIFCSDAGAGVLGISGVVQVLPSNWQPVPVAPEQVETIRLLCSSMRRLYPCALYEAGQRVEIMEGALQGAAGVILRVQNKTRLVVNVSIFNRAVAVELSGEAVQPCRP